MQLIEALQECHREHPVAKFWGHCNDQKIALDACFREEKKINRYAVAGVGKSTEKAAPERACLLQRDQSSEGKGFPRKASAQSQFRSSGARSAIPSS